MLVNTFFRYFYIIVPGWLHKTFPDNLVLKILSLTMTILICSLGVLMFVLSLKYCGGFGGLFGLSDGTKILCIFWKLSCNIFCIIISSCIYFIILRKRGNFLNSDIGPIETEMNVFSISHGNLDGQLEGRGRLPSQPGLKPFSQGGRCCSVRTQTGFHP